MKLRDLITDLKENDIPLVVFSHDSEGNSRSKLGGFYLAHYEATCGWSGTIHIEKEEKNSLVLVSSYKSKRDLTSNKFIEETKYLDPNLEVVISKYKGEGSPYDGYSKKYYFNGDTLYEDEFEYFMEHYDAKIEDFIPCISLFPVN